MSYWKVNYMDSDKSNLDLIIEHDVIIEWL